MIGDDVLREGDKVMQAVMSMGHKDLWAIGMLGGLPELSMMGCSGSCAQGWKGRALQNVASVMN